MRRTRQGMRGARILYIPGHEFWKVRRRILHGASREFWMVRRRKLEGEKVTDFVRRAWPAARRRAVDCGSVVEARGASPLLITI